MIRILERRNQSGAVFHTSRTPSGKNVRIPSVFESLVSPTLPIPLPHPHSSLNLLLESYNLFRHCSDLKLIHCKFVDILHTPGYSILRVLFLRPKTSLSTCLYINIRNYQCIYVLVHILDLSLNT